MKVLGHDARIPGATRGSHKAGDQVRENAGRNNFASVPPAELKYVADFLQVGRNGVAPAITLNRMYHCVPSSSSTIEPYPDRRRADQQNRTIGKSAVAGTEAAICAIG